jgi:hypothetical protein
VKVILMHAMVILDQTLGFPPMHSALLKPHRLSAWLEGASKLAMPECHKLLEAVRMLVSPEPPSFPPGTPATGPGRVSDHTWKAGAVLLQREVSACVLLLPKATVTLRSYDCERHWHCGCLPPSLNRI